MFSVSYNSSIKLLKINNHCEKIYNITPSIDQYDWNEIEFPSHKEDWNKFEKKKTVALNVLFVPYKTKQIRTAYVSRHNSDIENK